VGAIYGDLTPRRGGASALDVGGLRAPAAQGYLLPFATMAGNQQGASAARGIIGVCPVLLTGIFNRQAGRAGIACLCSGSGPLMSGGHRRFLLDRGWGAFLDSTMTWHGTTSEEQQQCAIPREDARPLLLANVGLSIILLREERVRIVGFQYWDDAREFLYVAGANSVAAILLRIGRRRRGENRWYRGTWSLFVLPGALVEAPPPPTPPHRGSAGFIGQAGADGRSAGRIYPAAG